MMGKENFARTMWQSAFPGHCPPCLVRGGRCLCGGPLYGKKSMCHTCEMDQGNAQGYSIDTKYLEEYSKIPLNRFKGLICKIKVVFSS